MARALGIPALVGAGEAVLLLAPGTQLLIDGQRGRLHVAPMPTPCSATSRAYNRGTAPGGCFQATSMNWPLLWTGMRLKRGFANIGESKVRVWSSRALRCTGLLRTELIFMAHTQAPDEATQKPNTGESSMAWTDALGGPYLMLAATNRCRTGRSRKKKTRFSVYGVFVSRCNVRKSWKASCAPCCVLLINSPAATMFP